MMKHTLLLLALLLQGCIVSEAVTSDAVTVDQLEIAKMGPLAEKYEVVDSLGNPIPGVSYIAYDYFLIDYPEVTLKYKYSKPDPNSDNGFLPDVEQKRLFMLEGSNGCAPGVGEYIFVSSYEPFIYGDNLYFALDRSRVEELILSDFTLDPVLSFADCLEEQQSLTKKKYHALSRDSIRLLAESGAYVDVESVYLDAGAFLKKKD